MKKLPPAAFAASAALTLGSAAYGLTHDTRSGDVSRSDAYAIQGTLEQVTALNQADTSLGRAQFELVRGTSSKNIKAVNALETAESQLSNVNKDHEVGLIENVKATIVNGPHNKVSNSHIESDIDKVKDLIQEEKHKIDERAESDMKPGTYTWSRHLSVAGFLGGAFLGMIPSGVWWKTRGQTKESSGKAEAEKP